MLDPLAFLRPPPGLSPADARMFTVRCALSALGALMHGVQAVVFGALGLDVLALVSIGSVGVFAVAITLIRRGWTRTGVWLAYGEVALHMPLLSVCLGGASGYPMYTFPLATVAFMAMTRDQGLERAVAIGYAGFAAAALYLWDRASPPLIELDPTVLSALFTMNVVGVLLSLVAVTAWFSRATDQAEAETARQRQRSEDLLRNILPDLVAERLKGGETVIADHFDSATVLFADIVGFTRLSSRVSTRELIELLNEIFSEFDALADRHGLEKIKTIGDAYMVVGGLPEPTDDHAAAVAAMALDMCAAVRALAIRRGDPLDIRVGVHSGPVVAGVIGRRKFAYDLWGDTVNTASRMESHGEPGRIQLSDATRTLLGEGFAVVDRGTIDVKGKGAMRTWWLEARASAGVRELAEAGPA